MTWVIRPRNLDQLSGVGISRPALPPGVLKQQRHLVTSRRYTSPTLPENQPTGGCPQGYADWCLAREIVKTVKSTNSLGSEYPDPRYPLGF